MWRWKSYLSNILSKISNKVSNIFMQKIVEIFLPLTLFLTVLFLTENVSNEIGMCSWTLWSTVEIWAWHPPAQYFFLWSFGWVTLVQLKGSRDEEEEEDQGAHPTQRRYCVYVCYAMHHNSSKKKKKSGCCQERAVLDPMTIREIHAGQRVTHTTETTVGFTFSW